MIKCIATGEYPVLVKSFKRYSLPLKTTRTKQLKKGDIISSGTFYISLKLEYGTYRAEYSGIGSIISVNK